jgi:hypothetical protein
MKRTIWMMIVIVTAISGLHAMKIRRAAYLSGKIYPAASVFRIQAIAGKDTVEIPVRDGAFHCLLDPGIYRILIEAKKPGVSTRCFQVKMDPGTRLQLGPVWLE